jgi:arylsulfatase A-like enzyme
MKSESNAPPRRTDDPGSLLAFAAWAGFLTGFAEVATIAAKTLIPELTQRSRDALWMIPAFDAALFVLIGVALVVIAGFVRLSWRSAAGIFAGIGFLLVLLLFKSLHPLASAALAAGVGLQVRLLLIDRAVPGARLVRRTLPWLALSVCVLAVLTIGWRVVRDRSLAFSRPPARKNAPNVLLLILDTVRAADMSLYGYARPTTPNLERLAENAVVFDRAFAPAPWTLPSHASMFTGRWSFELETSWEQALSDRWPTLAEVLRARGYATAAFVANDMYVTWETGLSRGFEHFDDYPVSLWTATQSTAFGRVIYPELQPPLAKALSHLPIHSSGLRLPIPKEHRPANDVIDAFLAWLGRDRSAPFFAVLNLMDAHFPYTPSDSFRYRFRSPRLGPAVSEAFSEWPERPLTPTEVRPRQDAYDGSITLIDAELGRLFRELGRTRAMENTIVIVTADHGDEYGEHGLVDHGRSLYRRSLRVPLVISFPGHIPAGRRVSAPVSLRNLAATVLDLIGAGQVSLLPGRPLTRFWTTQQAAPDTIVATAQRIWHAPKWYPASRGDLVSIAFNGWRYIRNQGDGSEELYDFDNDLLERWNLVGTDQGDRLLPQYRAALTALGLVPTQNRLADR